MPIFIMTTHPLKVNIHGYLEQGSYIISITQKYNDLLILVGKMFVTENLPWNWKVSKIRCCVVL